MALPIRVIVSIASLSSLPYIIQFGTAVGAPSDGRNQSLREGLPPLWQRFANLSAIPGKFPCESRERSCFQYGRLLHIDADGNANCYRIGSRGPCDQGQVFHIDVAEAFRRRGRLRGTCGFPCGFIFRTQLQNGRCQWRWRLQEQLCAATLEDFDGKKLPSVREWNRNKREWICVCYGKPCPSRQLLATPDGVCTAPDFLNPTSVARSNNRNEIFSCTRKEYECLREESIFYKDRCYKAMKQGPCNDREWLVADGNLRMKARCERRPCPEGQLLVPSSKHCLREQQIASFLCQPMPLQVDRLQGTWYCSRTNQQSGYITYSNEESSNSSRGVCYISYQVFILSPIAGIKCARNDLGECARNVILGVMKADITMESEDYF